MINKEKDGKISITCDRCGHTWYGDDKAPDTGAEILNMALVDKGWAMDMDGCHLCDYCVHMHEKPDSTTVENKGEIKMDLFDYLSDLKKIVADYKFKLTFEVDANNLYFGLYQKNTNPESINDPCEDKPINIWVCGWQHYKEINNIPAKIENYLKAYDTLQKNKD